LALYENVFSNQFEQTFVNGTSFSNFTITTTPGIATSLRVGARIIGGTLRGALYGNICELIVFSNALTTTQRQQVEGYLAWKWGLRSSLPPTTNHPYRYAPWVGTPTQIPGCTLWLDAADPSTLTLSGSNVTQWNDKSGNGYTLTVPSGRTAPTYSNGVIVTSGSNTLATTTNFAVSGNSPVTLALVYSVTGTLGLGPGAHIGSAGPATPPTYFGVVTYNGASSTVVYHPTCYGPDNEFAPGSVTGRRILGIGYYNGSVINGTYNGTLGSGQPLTSANFTSMPFYIGMRNSNVGEGNPGTICECVCYARALSQSEYQRLEGYLAWKWGIQGNLTSGATTHPYKSFKP
jgi:hypothetical protein